MDFCMEVDLYELIGVEQAASTQEIKKAYRKKALSCHPDKNPDNPKAAELFHELSRALEILSDASARAAYDKVLNAKLQAKLRVKEFDSKRKKLKEDLEARENAYRDSLNADYAAKSDKDKLQAEISRLQKEGSKQVEEEIALMRKQFETRATAFRQVSQVEQDSYKIKVKWKAGKNRSTGEGYSHDVLHRIFSKYGDVAGLVVSSSREGRALVEYRKRSDAETAANTEIGLPGNPLKLEKLWDTRKEETATATATATASVRGGRNMSDAEFELSVLSNLKRAEEKKRCLEKSVGTKST